VVLKLDAQRLRRSGVALPARFGDYLEQMQQKLQAKREAKAMEREARKGTENGKSGQASKELRKRREGTRKLAEENVS
jgi:hypothetical protein